MNLLMLDLDGTVRESRTGSTFINTPEDQRLIDGVEELIQTHYQGWKIVGITNQGGVAAGYKTFEDAKLEQKITLDLAPWMSFILFCPWSMGYDKTFFQVDVKRQYFAERNFWVERDKNKFRKPNPGMLFAAMRCFGLETPSSNDQILYVGDREEDKTAAIAAGVPFLWAHDWRNHDMEKLHG